MIDRGADRSLGCAGTITVTAVTLAVTRSAGRMPARYSIWGNHVRHVFGSRKRSGAGVVAIALVMAMVLAACGEQQQEQRRTTAAAARRATATGLGAASADNGRASRVSTPRRRSRPRAATMTFALDAESTGGWCLPEAQLAIAGIQVARSIYDYLTVPDDKGDYVPSLADTVTPNADYTSWTIQAPPGHQVLRRHAAQRPGRRGQPQRLPRQVPGPLAAAVLLRVRRHQGRSRSTDPMTVKVDMKTPWASFPAHLYEYGRLGIMGEAQLQRRQELLQGHGRNRPVHVASHWVPNNQLDRR